MCASVLKWIYHGANPVGHLIHSTEVSHEIDQKSICLPEPDTILRQSMYKSTEPLYGVHRASNRKINAFVYLTLLGRFAVIKYAAKKGPLLLCLLLRDAEQREQQLNNGSTRQQLAGWQAGAGTSAVQAQKVDDGGSKQQ